MSLSKNENKLFRLLVEYANDFLGNQGCNILSQEMKDTLSQEEWIKLNKEFHEWNGDSEEFDPNNFIYLPDFAVLAFLSRKVANDE
jgi:hypothetical protein